MIKDQPSATTRNEHEASEDQRGLLDALLAGASSLGESPSKSRYIDQVYDEFCLRFQAGEIIDPDQFCEEHPSIHSSLQHLIVQHIFGEVRAARDEAPAEEDWPHAGDEFLGLQLRRQIGRGGFARVFLATEPALGDRAVAVKVAHRGASEARTLGRLEHRNVVPVYSIRADEKTGLTAVCMPYLGSATLLDVLDRAHPGRLPVRASAILDAIRAKEAGPAPIATDPVLRKSSYVRGIVHLGAQLADALAYVHAEGVLHRDLKPSNVLLTPEGRPMLVDFNLAFDRAGERERLGGTLPYMSPEQLEATFQRIAQEAAESSLISSELSLSMSFLAADPSPLAAPPVDERSDVFSLGVLLYELLAGFHPFGARFLKLKDRELYEHLRLRHQQGPRPLHLVNPQVDPGLALLIDRCLALDPAERPATARDLAARLRRTQRGLRPMLARCAVPLCCALLLLVPSFVGGSAWLAKRTAPAKGDAAVGQEAFAQGQYDDAAVRFEKALKKDPKSPDLLLWLARTESQRGNLLAAEAALLKANALVSRGDVHAFRAYNILLMGEDRDLGVSDPEQALRESRLALECGSESAIIHTNLAYAAILRGEWDEADRSLTRAVALDGRFQGAYLTRVLLEVERTLMDGKYLPLTGVAAYRRALELGPVAPEHSFDGAYLCAEVAERGKRAGRADIVPEEYLPLARTSVRRAIEGNVPLELLQHEASMRRLVAELPKPLPRKEDPTKRVRPAHFFDPLARP